VPDVPEPPQRRGLSGRLGPAPAPAAADGSEPPAPQRRGLFGLGRGRPQLPDNADGGSGEPPPERRGMFSGIVPGGNSRGASYQVTGSGAQAGAGSSGLTRGGSGLEEPMLDRDDDGGREDDRGQRI